MNIHNCLNLCEIMFLFSNYKEIEELIDAYNKNSITNKIERIYIGSNFCSRYYSYLEFKYYENILDYCRYNNLKCTLVTPIINQKEIQFFIKQTSKFENFFDIIDEITINDFGMLYYIKEKYPNMKINFGRMLIKDTRDIRYNEYTNFIHQPEILTFDYSIEKKLNIRLNYYEFDITNKKLDFSNTNYKIAIHYNYLYQTVGNVCEFASIDLPDEKKFRPNGACQFQCMRTYMKYDAKIASYIKFGRTVYTKVNMPEILNLNEYRVILFPLDYLEGKI